MSPISSTSVEPSCLDITSTSKSASSTSVSVSMIPPPGPSLLNLCRLNRNLPSHPDHCRLINDHELDQQLTADAASAATESKAAEAVPQGFLDAMEVREKVFVEECGVPLENEMDDDDGGSSHWVAYATCGEGEVGVAVDYWKKKRGVPVGTLRLVPPPHDPHPIPDGVYVDGKLVKAADLDIPPRVRVHGEVGMATTGIWRDRRTSLHDGREPYFKLGRLAVVPDWRNMGVADMLVSAALEEVARSGVDAARTASSCSYRESVTPRSQLEEGEGEGEWKGLVCIHARTEIAETWGRKWGFGVDEEMGMWMEEGMEHVGMFRRVEVKPRE